MPIPRRYEKSHYGERVALLNVEPGQTRFETRRVCPYLTRSN